MTELDLHDVVLGGFSMGGGEVARYLGTYGSGRVSRAVFLAAVPPFLLKTDDNPQGVFQRADIEGVVEAIRADRLAYLTSFYADFYTLDETLGMRIGEEVVRDSWMVAAPASAYRTMACCAHLDRALLRDDQGCPRSGRLSCGLRSRAALRGVPTRRLAWMTSATDGARLIELAGVVRNGAPRCQL
jgi:pimeloyl-ACP methyl ester carboxylesterase